jgi:Plasmid pRiA4b ORF-3-like protein
MQTTTPHVWKGVGAMPRARRQVEPPIYTFRVRILGGFLAPEAARSVWREIEVAADQTLADLGEAIPLAFGFDDPHLWSFFLNGRAWDPTSEYALDSQPDPLGGPRARAARRAPIRDVPFPGASGKKEFLFVFDHGDEWHFGGKLVRLGPRVEPEARYPRVVAQQGKAPPQYPNPDEEDEEDEDAGEDEEES